MERGSQGQILPMRLLVPSVCACRITIHRVLCVYTFAAFASAVGKDLVFLAGSGKIFCSSGSHFPLHRNGKVAGADVERWGDSGNCGSRITCINSVDPCGLGSLCVAMPCDRKPGTHALRWGIVPMVITCVAPVGASSDVLRIFLSETDFVEINVIWMNQEDSFPAAIGATVPMFQIRTRLAFHRPTRRLDNGQSHCARAARPSSGNQDTASSVTGGVGDFRVATRAGAQFARATGERPSGGARAYRKLDFFTNSDPSPDTIRWRCRHRLQGYGARGARSNWASCSGPSPASRARRGRLFLIAHVCAPAGNEATTCSSHVTAFLASLSARATGSVILSSCNVRAIQG